jgi:hypothetical protein
MINWFGGMWYDWAKETPGNLITFLDDGGSFQSVGSIWFAGGSFYFGPRTISNSFDGDAFRLADATHPLNKRAQDYFARVPKGVPLHLTNTRSAVF